MKKIIASNIGKNQNKLEVSANGERAFLVIGDSWAQGSNNTTGPGPDATGHGYYFRTSDNTIQPITTTDIPGASNGSPWPQFCNDYFASTGYKSVIIPRGVGGTKFFDSWNGSSAAYSTSVTDANDAMTALGISKLTYIFIICGVNDAKSGDSLVTINANIGNLIASLTRDFPNTQIGFVQCGVSDTGNRHVQIRGYVKEWCIQYTYAQILCQAAPFDTWGLMSLDLIHASQTGNNTLGTMINRYLQMSPSINKWTRSIANSHRTTLSAGKITSIDTWVNALGGNNLSGQYFDLVGYWWFNQAVKDDVTVDWALINNNLIDQGYDFNANANITTDPTGSKALIIAIAPATVTYRFTATDLGIGATTLDRKGAFGTSTKYLMGTSSGSNVLGIAETNTGVMQYFAYDLGVTSTGTGGFLDNTEYAVDRVGSLKSRVVNGAVPNTESISPLAALSSGMGLGGRNTAGMSLFLNCEYLNAFWYKASLWNRTTFYNANVALKASW
jgi:hypothetical protein